MSIAKQEFTNAGRSMLGRAQNSEVLTITRIVVGDGVAAQPSDLWPLTAPIAQKLNVTISAKLDYGDGKMLVEGSFTSNQASAPFYLREVGVMAHVAGETDRLYSIANVFADPPDYIDPAAPTIQAFKIKLVIDRIPTASLVVQIGPSENVLGENMLTDAQGPGWFKEAIGNVLRFKRAIAGARVKLTEDAGHNSVTIAVATVEADLDLYVPLTYHGITDPKVLFPTIQAALDSVKDLLIPPDKFVTIHVDTGKINQSVTITSAHPNASQIKIVGQPLIAVTVSGNITRAGTLPNLDITFNVASLTGINVDDVVQLINAPHAQLESCGWVVSKRPTPSPNITVRMYIANVLPPSSVAALATTKLLLFPTQIACTLSGTREGEPTGGGDGDTAPAPFIPAPMPKDPMVPTVTSNYCFVFNTGNNVLKCFGIRAMNGQGNGVLMNDSGAIDSVSCVGFVYGFGIANGRVTLNPPVSANACQAGMSIGPYGTAIDGAVNAAGWDRNVWSGHTVYGLWILGSYYNTDRIYVYVCSSMTGFRVDGGYFLHGVGAGETRGGVVCAYNDFGIVAAIIGKFLTALDSINAVQVNNTLDCRAVQGSQIAIVHNASVPPNTKLEPDLLVLGADGGYISILSP